MEGTPGEKLRSAREATGAGATPEQKLAEKLAAGLGAEVQRKLDSFGGLLSRGAAVRLLCQENGISTEERAVLSQARGARLPFSFSARVQRVFPVQHFPGGSQKSVRLHVSDATGEATLVLWNEQAQPVEDGSILAGEQVQCTGAYFRSGEIAIGRGGSIARLGASSAAQVAALSPGMRNVEGVVESAEEPREYLDRRSGERKRMLSFTICSGNECCRAVWWSPPGDAPKLRKGDEVVLEGASFRGGELHLGNYSRAIVRDKRGRLQGKFRGIEFEGGNATIRIGSGEFRASLPEALSLFGLQQSMPGILPQTALSIKAGALEGKQALYSSGGSRLFSLQFQG
jgi:hypothetical protein